MNFKMEQHEYMSAVLDLLIITYSKQEALTKLIVNDLVKKGANPDDLTGQFNEDFNEARQKMQDLIYKEFGSTDITDILGDSKL